MREAAATPQRFGRYELLRPLGKGGMAELFLARVAGPGGIGKRLVVKRILPRLGADPRFVELFLREARIAVSLSHAAIVQIFEFGEIDGRYYLAMEHVAGCDLASAIARAAQTGDGGRPVPPLLAVYIAAEIARALVHAHGLRDESGRPLGLVHRDVNPRNVLLSEAGEVKLADFGVAQLRQAERGSDREGLRGTPGYLAPEQARGEAIDGRADLFALGLLLLELLTGERAYPTQDARVLVELARSGRSPSPPVDAPEALRAIVARAIAPAPGDRFATAAELLAALEEQLVTARARSPGAPLPAQLAEWLAGLPKEIDRAAIRSDGGEPGRSPEPERRGGGAIDTLLSAAATAADEPPGPAPPRPTRSGVDRPVRPTLRIAATAFGLVALAAAALALGGKKKAASAPLALMAGGTRRQVMASAPPVVAGRSAFVKTTLLSPTPPSQVALSPAPRPLRVVVKRLVVASAPPPASGTIDIGVKGSWALLTLDGQPIGETPLTGRSVAPGRHHLHAENPLLGERADVDFVLAPAGHYQTELELAPP